MYITLLTASRNLVVFARVMLFREFQLHLLDRSIIEYLHRRWSDIIRETSTPPRFAEEFVAGN
jgi:hypothetical protein